LPRSPRSGAPGAVPEAFRKQQATSAGCRPRTWSWRDFAAGAVPEAFRSRYDEQEALQRFAGEGLAGFLQKPFSLSQLTDKIVQLSRRFAGR
jgi:hypothetical protein